MAVEIREIVLRARVVADDEAGDGAAGAVQVDLDAFQEELMRAIEARIAAEFRRREER